MPASDLSIAWLVAGALVYLWYAWALSRLFPRIDAEAWRGWVPIVNEMTLFERGGVAVWKVLLYLVPVVNLYALYLRFGAASRIGRPWGRGAGFAALAIVVPPLWATLLAFGSRTDAGAAEQRLVAVAGHREVAGGLGQPQVPAVAPPGGPPERQVAAGEPPASPPAPASSAPAPESPSDASPDTTPAPEVSADAADPDDQGAAQLAAPVLRRRDVDPIEVHNPWSRPPVGASPRTASGQRDRTPGRPTVALPTWLDAVEGAVDGGGTGERAEGGPADLEPGHLAPASLPLDLRDDDDDSDEDGDEDGETVVVDRRPAVTWSLVVDDAGPLALIEDTVILGRRPASGVPGTQALAIPDATRTLSKAHARLELTDGAWTITDLDSTNGVLIVGADGEETAVEPGEPSPVLGRFLLGRVGMRITYEAGLS